MKHKSKIFLLIIAASLSVMLVFAQQQISVTIPSWGTVQVPVQGADYVVGIYNSTHYYAQVVSTGQYRWISTSATTIFDNVINSLTSGGKILVRNGTYYGYLDFYRNSGITVEGESRVGTIIYMPNGETERNSITIYDSSNVIIKNLKIYGNRANNPYDGAWNKQSGIFIDTSTSVTIENVWIDNTPRDGIDSIATNVAGRGQNMVYRNLILTDNGYNGMTIIIKKLGESHLIENFDISHGSDVGISCYGGQGVTIRNGVIHDMDGTYHSIQTHTALATEGSPDGDGVPGTGPGAYVYNVTSYNNYAGYYVLAGLPNVMSTLDHVNFTGGYGIRCASYSEQPVRMVNSYVQSDPHPDAAAFFIRNNNYIEVFNTTINGAIWVDGGNTIGSKFYHNAFLDPMFDLSGTVQITWDDGSRGNYWIDYTGQDLNGNGIGDTPYIINAQNQDNRPLMVPP